MFVLDNLMDMLFDSAMENLSRNERVIQLLKRLKLDPDHPPTDFVGVYQYALVEYGVGKPRPALEIFRQSEIQQLFREALEQNNPTKLLQHGEAFLADHPLQAELQANDIDVRREFYAFAAVFIEVAKRTRTPAAILAEQKLESLHRQIATVQERLSRLPTLEGLRTEMARLATTSSPALPAGTSFGAEESKAFALAQQMRGWFETLGFRFETHEVWQDDYFEWVINILVRRGRYDRILVRGIDGEAGLRDVEALKQSVETHRTDEGWLVTARRISRAARDEIEKPENDGLGCYTLDELLDQDADFSGYLTWLEAEIQKRGIDQKYVPLACLKEELDPDTKQRLGVSRYDDRDGWIDGYIDLWLDDPAKEHISVLGEFGTGKTWFALHYAWQALQRYREAQRRGLERPRLPLIIPLRDYAKAVSVESLFSEFFFRKHEIPIPGYSTFEQLNRMGKLLLIFDGFDEMAARVDRQEMINNFWELAKVVVPGAKVILTCRTEHFPEAKEGRALLNAELQASTRELTGETPQFEVLELEKFNDEQIRQVLSHQAQPATVEQIMGNPQLLDLARRPVLTELILEALPDIEAGKPVDMSRVYLYAVRHKLERDIKEERTFTSMADKLYFMCELSWEMLSTDRMSINYREFPDRIRKLFGSAVEDEKDLDHWHYDMMGQTMLIRNAKGDYTPAHRSLLEFFVAYKFAAELGALPSDFLELLEQDSATDKNLEPLKYTWSEYFKEIVQSKNTGDSNLPLKRFRPETLEILLTTVGRAPLTKALIDLLAPILNLESTSKDSLEGIVELTKFQPVKSVEYVGGNSFNLLAELGNEALVNKDFSNTVLKGANLINATLWNTSFKDANLEESNIPQVFGAIFAVAFSPNGNLFATGGSTCTVDIWEMDSNKLITSCKGHDNWIRTLAFDDEGKIYSGSFDYSLRIWNSNTGFCEGILEGHTSRVNCVIFNPKLKVLVSASDDQTIKIWNTETLKCSLTIEGHTSAVETLAIHQDTNTLISGSSDKTIRLWDLQSGECLGALQEHTGKVRSIALSPDGEILASVARDQTIRLWDWKKKKCMKVIQGHTDRRISSVTFNPSGDFLATGCYDQSIKIWKIKTGECLETLLGHTDWVRVVLFKPNSNFLISCSDDQTIRTWDVTTGDCINTLQGYTGEIRSVSLSPDQITLVAGCEDKCLRVWRQLDLADLSKPLDYSVLDEHHSRINSVKISPSGKLIATGSFDRTVKLWDVETGKCIKTLRDHEGCVNSVAFSSDERILASTGADFTIRLWSIAEGKCISVLKGHDNWLWSIEISPDNRLMASAGDDQTIRIWDFDSRECIVDFRERSGGINAIAFTSDSNFLVSGGVDRRIKLWNLLSKERMYSWVAHENPVMALAISPNGALVASSSRGRNIKLWELSTGELIREFHGHLDGVRSVVFSTDGTKLISGSFDQTIRIWDVETTDCLKIIKPLRPYEGMDITGIKGLNHSDKSSLIALGAIESQPR